MPEAQPRLVSNMGQLQHRGAEVHSELAHAQSAPAVPSVWPKQALTGVRASGPSATVSLHSAAPMAPTSTWAHKKESGCASALMHLNMD